jgi:hypothetical protein
MKKLLEAGCKLRTDYQDNWLIKNHCSLVVFAAKANGIDAVTRMVAGPPVSDHHLIKKDLIVLRAPLNDVTEAPLS